MKITGLGELIRCEETEECRLENCNLVVDAHKFFYNSYNESKAPYVFGCDAKNYAKYVRVKKLLRFKRANINCYFVFKGGTTSIDLKISNAKSHEFDFETNHKFIPPIFMTEVCQQMVEEVGFKYTTSITSNTNDCIALAEALDCPVLSSNTDYCFRNVPYIPLNTFTYSTCNDHIMAGKFKLQNFLEKHSLTEKKCAIFVTLSDVFSFEQNHFDDLFKTWNVFDENSKEQIKKLLMWLSEHTEEEAITDVSGFLADDTEKFHDQMQNVLNKMHHRECSIATEYLFNDCRLKVIKLDPRWFEKGVALQYIAIPYINLYKYKTISGSTAIEKKGSVDSIITAINIIVYAYNLLTNFQQSEITIIQDSNNVVKINTKEYSVRKQGFICKESVFENGWQVLGRMNLFEYFLRENKIYINSRDNMPRESKVFLFSLAYFSRKKMDQKIDVTKEVHCFIIYNSISSILRRFSLHESNMHPTKQEECKNLIQFTQKYFKLEENEEEAIFDGEKLKTLVEIQYCLLHMNYLNILCGKKYEPTRYHRYVNCPFVFKLLKDMENLDSKEFLASQFKSFPSVLNHIHMLLNGYSKLLDNSWPVENWRASRR